MEPARVENWQYQTLSQLKRLGFDTLTAYFKACGVFSYDNLAGELDIKLTPDQVEKQLRSEVRDTESFQFFARAILVLGMRRKCPLGWRKYRDFDRSLTIGHWGGALGEANTPQVCEVSRRLRSTNGLPDDWLPSGVDDQVIVRAFDGIVFQRALPGPP